MVYNDIKHVLNRFAFEGRYAHGEEIQSGLVNNTYHLTYIAGDRQPEYILQQINSFAFKRPDVVMSNIGKVTEHLRSNMLKAGIDPERRTLSYIKADNGTMLLEDEQGRFWRAYKYISHAFAYDTIKPEHFREAGMAFGEFQKLLSDFPVDELQETIPDFHDTRKRFFDFVASVAQDAASRVKEVEPEIDFLFDRRKMMSEVMRMMDAGELPRRVTHNDTKINNVLIDEFTEKAICVIDLDTVMPGTVLYDFGDAIRFGASTAAEDEPDTDIISLDIDMFKRFSEGFISQANGILTPNELKCLPLGAKVMTCELMMRFLKDYIDGDVYFKVNSPKHNLIRARAQMKLLTDMEAKYQQMCDIVGELTGK